VAGGLGEGLGVKKARSRDARRRAFQKLELEERVRERYFKSAMAADMPWA
jgi:hypothetical protein